MFVSNALRGGGVRPMKTLKASLPLAVAIACLSHAALADEGGVSFWLPGFFGSLAAAPLQPGFALTSMYYHTSVSADGEVARAQEIRIGRIPATVAGSVSANLDANASSTGGWNLGRADQGNPAGGRRQSRPGQSLPALCVRCLDDTDVSGRALVPLC